MKSELIQPFVEALVKVFEESTGGTVKRGAITIKSSPLTALGVASLIGITGEAEGRVILDMSRETATALTSGLNAEQINAGDRLVASTVNEMANMVCGRAVSSLVNQGHTLAINPPTFFSGREMDITNNELEMVVVPLETKYGNVNINIALRSKY
jgi:chemotaxis protein CheX